MTQQTLEGCTTDDRIYTLDLSDLLAAGQTVTAVTSIGEATDTLTVGSGVVNTQAVTLPSGEIIPIGQALQVELSCTNPSEALAGQQSVTLTIIAVVATSTDRAVTAVVPFFLCDTPGISADGGCC